MQRSIGVMVLFGCLMIGGSAFAGTERCERAIRHVQAAQKRGDLPIAKLLVDFALADAPRTLGCSDGQCGKLLKAREEIYVKCISERLVVATNAMIFREDGITAMDAIVQANDMAQTIRIDLWDIEQLYAQALIYAAFQELAAAKKAEQEGDPETGVELRRRARAYMKRARAIDPSIESIVQEGLRKK